MSSFAASNADDEPPRKINQPMSPASFCSLPKDIVYNILARLPKRSYPILSCVSKNLRNLVRSPEIHRTRYLLGKDSLFICFINKTNCAQNRCLTLHRTERKFVIVDLNYPYHFDLHCSIIAVGPEIFLLSGKDLWIFDSVSCKIRQGPSMRLFQLYKSVGFVGSKIYAIGGSNVHAESFDLRMETWEPAKIPEERRVHMWFSSATESLNRKVCALNFLEDVTVCYDIRDGSCESFELPKDKWWKTGVCVIDNVLYVYYARFGLMWYDFELRLWRVVNGLRHLNKVRSVGMAEIFGKMAFFWKELCCVRNETKWIWYRMITLHRSEVGIHGTVEPAQLLGSFIRCFRMQHCLSLSD